MHALVVRFPDPKVPQKAIRKVLHRSPVKMGRHPLAELCIAHQWISKWHGVIEFTEDNIRFTHQGTNTTIANGKHLARGETIDLGRRARFKVGPMHIQAELEELRSDEEEAESPTQNWSKDKTEAANLGESLVALRALGSMQGEIRQLSEAWRGLRKKVVDVAGKLEAADRDVMMEALTRTCPEVGSHPDLLKLLAEVDAKINLPPQPASYELIRQMAKIYAKDAPAPTRANELESCMHQVAAVLEVFGEGFVDARNAYLTVAKGMEINLANARNPLAQSEGVAEVLQRVLHWESPENSRRLDELRSLTADISLHQLAMLEAFKAGISALLLALGPEEISADVGSALIGGGERKWRRFCELHEDLSADQAMLNSVVFGFEFRSAYYKAVYQARDERGAEDEAVQASPTGPMEPSRTQVPPNSIMGMTADIDVSGSED